MLEIASVPVIIGIVFFVMEVYKALVKNAPAVWTNLIPVWAAILGVGLGVIAFFFAPAIMPADDILTAILIGLASGLGAVGIHQVGKQISNTKNGK